MLEPEPELFDVVIVDEASQTGIDGLFLYYLGRQTVVVGDHHQISPAGVGVHGAAIAELQRRFLEDIPFPAALEATASLYDHAKIKYQSKLVLQEHFRCVPEIIQFSNDLCYAPNGTPLVPLRTYPPKRLRPVVSRFVKGGYQEGRSSSAINRPEAEQLVAQLSSCLSDDRYQGMTFGVISLLGSTQARLIHHLLTQVVGPEVMEERDLVCGDAYAFQGDERDIMFLSMVSASNARIGALTASGAVQRFNVAASRAKDQLWLFHSVQPEDLSDKCVRRRLLEYCLDPAREPLDGDESEFESKFERDVYDRIRARGYRVRTQVKAGDQTAHSYRIDLVVDGLAGSLAVECDGDEWHGPEQYEADMARQRDLERARWRFFRVRGGTFYRDPESALEPLWRELEELEIRPWAREGQLLEEEPEPAELGGVGDESSFLEGVDKNEEDDAVERDDQASSAMAQAGDPNGEALGHSKVREESRHLHPPTGTHHRPDSLGSASRSGGREPAVSNGSEERARSKERKPPPGKGRKTKRSYSEEDLRSDNRYLEGISAAELLEASHWAKVHEKLQGWQRGVLYSVGKNKKLGRECSDKQVRRAAEAHRQAASEGFQREEDAAGSPPSSPEGELANLSEFEQELVGRVLERVAESTGHSADEFVGEPPDTSAGRARSLAAYLLTLSSGLSASAMKEVLGFENESAVEQSVRDVERLKEEDSDFAAIVTDSLAGLRFQRTRAEE